VISLYNTNPNIKNFDLTGIAIAKRDLGIACCGDEIGFIFGLVLNKEITQLVM